MDKMSFREGQLAVLGATVGRNWSCIMLNSEQVFNVGDNAEVVEIELNSPHIVVRMADGPESLCHIDNFSDKVIDECVEILRGVAAYYDWENNKEDLSKIKSNNNPRA